jgi:hypothetical protein
MSEKIDRPVLYELGIVCKDSNKSLAHPDLYLYVVYRWLAKLFTEKEKSLSFAVRSLAFELSVAIQTNIDMAGHALGAV